MSPCRCHRHIEPQAKLERWSQQRGMSPKNSLGWKFESWEIQKVSTGFGAPLILGHPHMLAIIFMDAEPHQLMNAATPSWRCGSNFSIRNQNVQVLRVGHPSGHLLRRCYRFHHLPTPIRRILKKKLGKSAFECSKHCFANSNMMQKIGVVSCQQTSLETNCNSCLEYTWIVYGSKWSTFMEGPSNPVVSN